MYFIKLWLSIKGNKFLAAVIHSNDIKPCNIIYKHDIVAKVIDYTDKFNIISEVIVYKERYNKTLFWIFNIKYFLIKKYSVSLIGFYN